MLTRIVVQPKFVARGYSVSRVEQTQRWGSNLLERLTWLIRNLLRLHLGQVHLQRVCWGVLLRNVMSLRKFVGSEGHSWATRLTRYFIDGIRFD